MFRVSDVSLDRLATTLGYEPGAFTTERILLTPEEAQPPLSENWRASAMSRAMFLYWAYLGQAAVTAPRHGVISAAAVEDLSDLFER